MRDEELYLADIIKASHDCARFAKDGNWETFQTSGLHQSAVQYKLMVIGEAASKISRGLKSRHPEIAWLEIKNFRNVLAHEYFALDLEIIWASATMRVEPLAEQIINILKVEYPGFPIPEKK